MVNKHRCINWNKQNKKCKINYECCPNDWDEEECDGFKKAKTKKIHLKKIKKIEFASNKKVAKYDSLSVKFISKIFGIKNFMISDETCLTDFMNVFDRSDKAKQKLFQKIYNIYGIDVSRMKQPLYLWKILKKITPKNE